MTSRHGKVLTTNCHEDFSPAAHFLLNGRAHHENQVIKIPSGIKQGEGMQSWLNSPYLCRCTALKFESSRAVIKKVPYSQNL